MRGERPPPFGPLLRLIGGNFNNGSNDGPFYLNGNNGWGNGNWNIGVGPILHDKMKRGRNPTPHASGSNWDSDEIVRLGALPRNHNQRTA